MITKIVLLLLALQISLMPLLAADQKRPRDLDARLRTSVHSYELQSNNLIEALTEVASEFQIPMGIEWVNTPAALTAVHLSWKNATVRDVLEDIIKTQPDFKMFVGRDIIHIFAPELIPDRENPVKLNIREFEVHDVPLEAASRQLHKAVNQILSPPRHEPGLSGGIVGSGFSNVDEPTISATLKNVTVEDVLDALVLASTRKIWIVPFSSIRTLTATGHRRTLTNSPTPDTDQPVWALLHWGDKIYMPNMKIK